MQVSSELPQAADSVLQAFVCDVGQLTERPQVEDEEFPSDLAGDYDWLLQPASQFNSKRVTSFVALIVTIVLIAASVFNCPRPVQSFALGAGIALLPIAVSLPDW